MVKNFVYKNIFLFICFCYLSNLIATSEMVLSNSVGIDITSDGIIKSPKLFTVRELVTNGNSGFIARRTNTGDISTRKIMTTSRDISEIYKSGIHSASFGCSFPFLFSIEGSTHFESSQKTRNSTQTDSVFKIESCLISKMELSFLDEAIELSSTFISKLKDFCNPQLNYDDKTIVRTCYTGIWRLINEFGLYIPTKITFGGKLISTETINTSERTNLDQSKSNDRVNINGKVPLFSIKDKYEYESTSNCTIDSFFRNYGTTRHIQYVGGNPNMQLEGWLRSLDHERSLWSPIEYSGLKPFLYFMDKTEKLKKIRGRFLRLIRICEQDENNVLRKNVLRHIVTEHENQYSLTYAKFYS